MLSDSTRAVIERLIEVVQLDAADMNPVEFTARVEAAIAEARMLLADDGWIRVEDALPVVPDGENGVDIAVFEGGDVIRTYWRAGKTSFVGRYSHWKYEPLPQPPKEAK